MHWMCTVNCEPVRCEVKVFILRKYRRKGWRLKTGSAGRPGSSNPLVPSPSHHPSYSSILLCSIVEYSHISVTIYIVTHFASWNRWSPTVRTSMIKNYMLVLYVFFEPWIVGRQRTSRISNIGGQTVRTILLRGQHDTEYLKVCVSRRISIMEK